MEARSCGAFEEQQRRCKKYTGFVMGRVEISDVKFCLRIVVWVSALNLTLLWIYLTISHAEEHNL